MVEVAVDHLGDGIRRMMQYPLFPLPDARTELHPRVEHQRQVKMRRSARDARPAPRTCGLCADADPLVHTSGKIAHCRSTRGPRLRGDSSATDRASASLRDDRGRRKVEAAGQLTPPGTGLDQLARSLVSGARPTAFRLRCSRASGYLDVHPRPGSSMASHTLERRALSGAE